MRISVATLVCFSVASFQVTANEVNAKIDQLCSTEHMLIKHSVTIGQANAVANNRAQHYQIQPSLSDEQKSKLATSNITLGDDCLEYLSSKDVLEVDSDGVVARVYFNFDKSELTETSKLTLTTLAERIQSLGEVPNLNVVGHTDNVGSETYNKQLGEYRALSSKVYLVESGVKKEILTPHTEGFNSPIKDNETKEGRAANRRVEIVVADQS
ncbi:OmpA family protein [Vibrio breoganii]|uniref:OmpA family protein n=1 Tax=Vibrio breoganii TaxID=553239 RepID=A0ABX1U759_9VIBR|nr:OmpA family protein [Vibrio breoganii]NMO72682.1 OmpA family protein [Vibrio breoganii]NMR69079.1 OmpA family protein [Vibrio breoganii]OED97862.1 hypothetical protein A1QG_09880 [Vibrio breoganii ZF-29]OEF86988.1 hypothetical protein B003_15470 [Vibrio breoganii 1C10]PMG03251.1 hypothetical protein BCV02_09065 [Vibrio breoganii]